MSSRAADNKAHLEALEKRVVELESLLGRQAERYRSIEDIALALGSTLDLDELLVVIMDEVTRLMEAERSTLFLVDEQTGELWSKVAQDSGAQEIRVHRGEGIAGFVAETGEPVNVDDAYTHPRFQPEWDKRTGFRTASVLCMPIRNNRGIISGVIQVLNKRTGHFRGNDETLLAALAAPLAVSVENGKLYQSVKSKNAELLSTQRQLERKMFELEFLYQLEQDVSQVAESEAIERVIARTAAALDVEGGSVLLTSAGGDVLVFKHATGERSDALKELRLDPHKGIAGWVAQYGKPVLTNEPMTDPRHHWPLAEAIGFPARSLLCVPLQSDEVTVGAFELINKRHGGFTEDDLKLVTLAAGIVSRVVQQSRHKDAQERASRLADLGQMLSGILHDFKTPMTIISGYAQLMVHEKSGTQREESCANILRQFEHLNNMTQEILAFARGDSKILFRRVYVHKFMEEIEELLTPEFQNRRIPFALELRYRGTARFDEGKMRRAIYNISRNAIEAMPAGTGSFRIVVDKDGSDLVVEFKDTGPGIPEDIQPRLFQSFVTKGKTNGTGLGLAIVKKIVDEHHGHIHVETALGRGTTLYCRFPLDPEAAVAAAAAPVEPRQR